MKTSARSSSSRYAPSPASIASSYFLKASSRAMTWPDEADAVHDGFEPADGGAVLQGVDVDDFDRRVLAVAVRLAHGDARGEVGDLRVHVNVFEGNRGAGVANDEAGPDVSGGRSGRAHATPLFPCAWKDDGGTNPRVRPAGPPAGSLMSDARCSSTPGASSRRRHAVRRMASRRATTSRAAFARHPPGLDVLERPARFLERPDLEQPLEVRLVVVAASADAERDGQQAFLDVEANRPVARRRRGRPVRRCRIGARVRPRPTI